MKKASLVIAFFIFSNSAFAVTNLKLKSSAGQTAFAALISNSTNIEGSSLTDGMGINPEILSLKLDGKEFRMDEDAKSQHGSYVRMHYTSQTPKGATILVQFDFTTEYTKNHPRGYEESDAKTRMVVTVLDKNGQSSVSVLEEN